MWTLVLCKHISIRLELAEMLGVRPGTVYSWITRGVDIPHVKIEGVLRFIRKAGRFCSHLVMFMTTGKGETKEV